MENLLRKVLALLFASFLSHAPLAEVHEYGGFKYQIDPMLPSWVEPFATFPSTGKPSGQNTEYIALDKQVNAEPGNYQEYIARQQILHNSQAVSDGSQLELFFNPEYQTLTIHKLTISRNGEVINKLNPAQIRLLQQEQDLANGILNGEVTAVVIIPNTRPGDRLDYSYTITGRNPIFADKIFGAYQLGWAVDIGKNRFRLRVPKPVKIQTEIQGLDLKPKVKKRDGFREYTWQVDKILSTNDEGDYPAWYTPYPFLEYTEFKDWQEVENWAQTLFGAVDQGSKELDQLVETMADDFIPFEGYALEALRFAQEEVRYVGIELGVNSHLPHDPKEVLENRYGDCKDKSNLLVQLLKRRGIEAYPALVSYSLLEGFDRFLPRPSVFDHAIVMAIIDGKKVWFDPTRTYQTGKLESRAPLKFGKALVIGKEQEQPVHVLEPLSGQVDLTEVVEHYSSSDLTKPTRLVVNSYYHGVEAENMRYNVNYYSLEELEQHYLNYYAKLYPTVTLAEGLSYQDYKERNIFALKETYLINDFFEINKDDLYQAEFYLGNINQSLRSPKIIRRSSPLSIGSKVSVEQEVIVDFPGEIGITIDSVPVIKKTEGLEYVSRSVYFDGRFEHKSQLNVLTPWIESSEVENYMMLKDFISDDVSFWLSFNYPRKNEPVLSDNVEQLSKALVK